MDLASEILKTLSTEIVKALEAGINKQLSRSISYSAFRLFYNLFKRNNPVTIRTAREIAREDIHNSLAQIPNFDFKMFINDGKINDLGKKLLQKNYNVGINLMKKELNTMSAFKVIINSDFRMQIYNLVLLSVQQSAIVLMPKT